MNRVKNRLKKSSEGFISAKELKLCSIHFQMLPVDRNRFQYLINPEYV